METLKTIKQNIEKNILVCLLESCKNEVQPRNTQEYREMIQNHHISMILHEEVQKYIQHLQRYEFVERQYEILISDYFLSEWFHDTPYNFENEGNEDRVISILYEIVQYPSYEIYKFNK